MTSFRTMLVGALTVLLTTTSAWAQLNRPIERPHHRRRRCAPWRHHHCDTDRYGACPCRHNGRERLYVLPNLPTGPYRLEAMLQGFRTFSQTGIVLQVAATPAINVVLAVGNLEETVSVEAAAPLVDVRSAGISDVVDNERILELPLQGRQVTDLIVLAGAAVQTEVVGSRNFPGGVPSRSPAAFPSASATCSTARRTTARRAT